MNGMAQDAITTLIALDRLRYPVVLLLLLLLSLSLLLLCLPAR